MKKQYFGTDGIRGRVGEEPITPEFMLKLGWAAGRVFARENGHPVLIGKDTRISGYMFESTLEAGLSAAGVNIQLLGPMPTPGIAYLARTFRARAGIVISASHNPYYDNGIKFFSGEGAKLPDETELEIERELQLPMQTVDSARLGKAVRVGDAAGRYIEFCKSTIPAQMDFTGLKVVVDCAHGATYHIAPHVFQEVGASVLPLGVSPSGLNINEGCGATSPDMLARTVVAEGADLGIALDGDGDRLILVDHKGDVVDGDEALFIIARARRNRGELQGPVVGTLMSNFGLEQALQEQGIQFIRAAVGDRYVLEQMLANGASLGGESSGHIICRDRTTTGDGIISALQVLAEMWASGQNLHQLKQGMQKCPQVLRNIRIADRQVDLDAYVAIQKARQEVEQALGAAGRVLLRKSGTEPLVRVMVEGPERAEVVFMADHLAEVVGRELSS